MVEVTQQLQQRNLELTRRGFDLFSAGDTDGLLALYSEDVEIYMPSELPNSGTFRGHDGFLKWVGQWLEAWEDFTIEIREMVPVGARHVVTTMHQSATGKGSGIPVEMEIAYMTDIEGERLVALHLYATADDAVRVARQRESERAD